LLLNADGRYLISGGFDQKLKVWDVGSTHPTFSMLQEVSAHSGPVTCIAMDFFETNRKQQEILVSGSSDGTLKLWTCKFPSSNFLSLGSNSSNTQLIEYSATFHDKAPCLSGVHRSKTKQYRAVTILPPSASSKEGSIVLTATKDNRGRLEAWKLDGALVDKIQPPSLRTLSCADSDEECLGLNCDDDGSDLSDDDHVHQVDQEDELLSSIVCLGRSKFVNHIIVGSNDRSAAVLAVSDEVRRRAK
jgi:WD40 repeat protein